jgi:hypothetical protein
MREEALKQFFAGNLSADQLAIEAAASIKKVGPIETNIEIEDMSSDYAVCRDNVLLLCDAGLRGDLPGGAITAVAFMLLASDRFEWDWDDDVIPEVLNDWSCPEVNYPLEPSTFQMHRRWLLGSENPPERPPLARKAKRGRLISIRRKVHVKGGP